MLHSRLNHSGLVALGSKHILLNYKKYKDYLHAWPQ